MKNDHQNVGSSTLLYRRMIKTPPKENQPPPQNCFSIHSGSISDSMEIGTRLFLALMIRFSLTERLIIGIKYYLLVIDRMLPPFQIGW